jgi:hypothetical protein
VHATRRTSAGGNKFLSSDCLLSRTALSSGNAARLSANMKTEIADLKVKDFANSREECETKLDTSTETGNASEDSVS